MKGSVGMGIYLNPGNKSFWESLRSRIYVDKTNLIACTNEFVNTREKFICVSRPRRFGKSMAADMLAAYYGKGCDSGELFVSRKIENEESFLTHLNQHNVTLVIAGMREGNRKELSAPVIPSGEKELSKVPLVSRLATFISVTSLELEEINNKLELANDKLKTAAIIDGLTGLYNRKEIQTQIEKKLNNASKGKFSVAMFDIDNFKQVNDTYGHQEGDTVIVALANILNNERAIYTERLSAGRWGGEEFMLLLNDTDISAATLIADLIRQCFSNTSFPSVRTQTVSVGVTQAREDDSIDTLCTRVDTALYKAKKTGKNRVVVI